MKRRLFLQGALSLPWLAGCLSRSEGGLQGGIVGANFWLGHRLRQPLPRAGTPRRVDVLIAGGGVAGLAAAWRLRQAGVENFELLELESEVGGNSRAAHYSESAAPWAAHYLPVPTREATVVRRLLSEMGLLRGGRLEEAELCHSNEERVFVLGRWEEGIFPKAGASSDDFRQLREFEEHIRNWQKWRDAKGRKAFAIPVAWSSPEPEVRALDQENMADYLTRHGWTSPRLRWYVEYGCRDDYGCSLQNTSAWAGLHYFASRDGGGFEPKDMQFVWPEGNHRLVQHLASGLGDRVRTGRLVTRIEASGKRWVVEACDREGRMASWSAAGVIFALPTFLRPYLLKEPVRPAFSYAPWTVCNLVLERLPESVAAAGMALSWDNVIYDSPGLGYVVATHQTQSHLQGPSVWTYYRPWAELEPARARQRMLAADWSEVCQQVFAELGPVHPDLREVCRRLEVMQLGHAMVRPSPGFLWSSERREAALPQPGLYYAHSDLSGLSIFEEASYQGVRAAQELLAERGRKGEDFLRE
ncbi:MAG: FAD-dependent oxidoreductase [Candidatus Eremiobacteraeota bacterium]|nr:FAD-dependent oxidoreductase [Candidatus Eremiobacteraeota bacterium]MCW5866326.1 FAD-dependent oxidoreductase [Candidatus Eremiobacteraeota bacterium]